MAKEIEVEVLKKDIVNARESVDSGDVDTSNVCPIARALKRRVGHEFVFVNGFTADIDGIKYILPKEATDFVVRFDEGHLVSPISFTIRRTQ